MADENNKSDYNKKFMDLVKLLPEPYKSDVNESIFSNLFNRFLSKQETIKVSGYIGKGNKNAIVSRQIKEKDIHRQAFQLQPILYNKIGSIEHMASWKDIQNELIRHGIDIEDFDKWGATEKFNWVPPIDINKLINYQDYYWVDKPGENTIPQYITIRSKCSTASSRLTFWENVLRQYGSTFPILEILKIDDVNNIPSYQINFIDAVNGEIYVIGDITTEIKEGQFVEVLKTTGNNGIYEITGFPVYDGVLNVTKIPVNGLASNESTGVLSLRKFDKLVLGPNDVVLDGDYSRLMEPGFIFFVKNIQNDEIKNSFVKVVSAEYNNEEKTTIVKIDRIITNDNVDSDSVASLEEQQLIYIAEKNCQCKLLGGWDDGSLWDDNPDTPLWGDDEDADGNPFPDGIADHTNFLNRISNSGPPTTAGTEKQVWYDTVNDKLYQYSTSTGWKVLWNSFSLLLDATTGFSLWDEVPECDTRPRIKAADQWINENRWQHRNDITNFANVKRAKQPIIEYDWDLELNEWTYVDYRWAYRAEEDDNFVETDINPPKIEIEPLIWWETDSTDLSGKTIILDFRYGDLTDWFIQDRLLYIGDDSSVSTYEVEYSEYKSVNGFPYRTYVIFKNPLSLDPTKVGDLSNFKPSKLNIFPFETINGDPWQGYGVHWLMLGAKDALPVPHQVDNPYINFDKGSIGIPVYDGTTKIYEYITSFFAQQYTITSPSGIKTFMLSDDVKRDSLSSPLETVPLNRKALYGFDDVRVYLSDILGQNSTRQFGNYDEIGEAVLHVVNIDFTTNEFIIGGDWASYFNIGEIIKLSGNSGIGEMTFTISNIPPSNGYRLRVNETIPAETTISGEISNVTAPLPGDDFTNTKYSTVYVSGIRFFDTIESGQNVVIEVGAASITELGNHVNYVRTTEDNNQYAIDGNIAVSQIRYRRVEQIKTKTNQYPLFDIFNIDGTPAYKANPIFGYKTSPDYDINPNTGLRIVYDSLNNIYEFDQFLLEEENGELLAYRDYAGKKNDYWFNPETKELFFWVETEWSNKTDMSGYYRKAIVSDIEPNVNIDGFYWFNTLTNTLYRKFVPNPTEEGSWIEIKDVDIRTSDINLQTIWKIGLNKEQYIPAKVDWSDRSLEEYNKEKDDYINARIKFLLIDDPSLSKEEAINIATIEWYKKESNELSPDGKWVGDWEIPDPLYYNHLHENRKYLNTRELLTHFTTIIEQQQKIPGYVGTKEGMFNLIPSNSVNYAYGGTIKEFNNGFDILLSSTFVNNVIPPTLIEFANEQYENLLNILKETYTDNAVSLLSSTEIGNILDISKYISNEIIKTFEENEALAFIYGDTTTFTDVKGGNDKGVRNWIATLPYLSLIQKTLPRKIVDEKNNIFEIVHHDSHKNTYALSTAIKDIISNLLIETNDPRSDDTLGKKSHQLPPNNITEFNNSFNGQILGREGVYWYYNTTNNKILYRYVVAESGTVKPSDSYPDGTLWMDLTASQEVLRIKKTDIFGNVEWQVVDGLTIGDGRLHNGTDPNDLNTATISAWKKVDLDELLNDIILEIETRLYNNVPDYINLTYDFEKIQKEFPEKYLKYLEEAFLNYVSEKDIDTPYANTIYKDDDAFTWNYKQSAHGGGISILEADGLTNSFVVAGNKVSFFDPCSASAPAYSDCPSETYFFVKNSDVNNGTWVTLTSTSTSPTAFYDSVTNTTRVFVKGDVKDSTRGIIYKGLLPSEKTPNVAGVVEQPNNLNDGSESGGYWKDLYNKFYNTPYPHREPWILQGYKEKPEWWDEEYLNDDPKKWGNRIWKYKHGFEITFVDNGNDNASGDHGLFGINGDFHTIFKPNEIIQIDSSSIYNGNYVVDYRDLIISVNEGPAGTASIVIDDSPPEPAINNYSVGMKISIIDPLTNNIKKTFTISAVNHVINTFIISVEEEILVGDITQNVDRISGATYDPITNLTKIKLQNVLSDTSVIDGRIVKPYGMWENIRIGVIPAGKKYPNGVISITGNPTLDYTLNVPQLPKFNYFSINISNKDVSSDGGITIYGPDDLLPPYWDHTVVYSSTPVAIDRPVRTLYFDYSTEISSPNSNYSFNDIGFVEWEWRESSKFLYDNLIVSYRIDPSNFILSTFGFDLTEIGGLKIDKNTKKTPSHNRITFHGEIVNGEVYKSNGLNQWYVNFNRYAGYDASFYDFRQLWTGWTAPLTYQFSSFIDTQSMNVAHRYVDISKFDYNVSSKRVPGVEDYWLDALKIGIIDIPYNTARFDNQLDWRFVVKTNLKASRKLKYYDVHNYQFYADPNTDTCHIYTWEIKNINTYDKSFTINGDHTYAFKENSTFDIFGSTDNDKTYSVLFSVYDRIYDETTIYVNETIPSPEKDGLLKSNYRKLPWKTGDIVYLSTTELLPSPLIGDTINGLTKYYIIIVNDTSFKLALTELDAKGNNNIEIVNKGRRDHYVGQIASSFVARNGVNTKTIWKLYTLDKNNILEVNTPHEIQGMQKIVDFVNGYSNYMSDIGWKVNDDKTIIDPDTQKPTSWIIELERFISYAYSQRIIREKVGERFKVSFDESTNKGTFIDTNKSFITGDPILLISTNNVYPTPLNKGIRYYIIRDTLEEFRLASSRNNALNGVEIDITSASGVGDLYIYKPKISGSKLAEFEINPFRNTIWFNQPRGIVSNILTGPAEDIRSSQLIFDQNGERIDSDKLRVYRQDKQTKITVVDSTNGETIPFVTNQYDALHLGGLHLFIDAYEHVLMFNNYTSENNLLYDPFIGLNVTKFEMLFNKQPEFTHRPNVGGYYIETFFNQGTNIKENIETGIESLRNAYDTFTTFESNTITQQSRKSLGYEGVTDYLSNLNLSEKSQFLFWRGQIQNKGSINAVKAYINSRRFIDAKIDDFWAVKVGTFGSIAEKEYPEMYVTTVDARSNELRLEFIDNESNVYDDTFTPIKMSDSDRWYNQPDQIKVLRDNGKVLYFDMKVTDKKTFTIIGSPNDIIVNNGNNYIYHGMDSDYVEITYLNPFDRKTYKLKENIDFIIVNNNIIKLLSISIADEITIWGLRANDNTQNPARLVDRETETQITPIQYWDPARGIHYSNAIHNIDLINNEDPAMYTNTPRTVSYKGRTEKEFVGTTWLNTANLYYVPYYSEQMIPDITERFRNWGQLTDWANIEICEWVESDVHPSQWDDIASKEEGDRTIPESIRKAGRARKVLFEKNPLGDFVVSKPIVQEFYVSIDGLYNSIDNTYDFGGVVDIIKFYRNTPIDIYINGKLYRNVTVGGSPLMPIYNFVIPATDVKESDIISFVQNVPSDRNYIDAQIALGNMVEDYEYTQIPYYDDLGNINYKYYFWVVNKGTKAANRNRTMPILEVEKQILSIPAAHMFFQKPLPSLEITGEEKQVDRSEIHLYDGTQNTFVLELPIYDISSIKVEINGIDLPSNYYTYGGSPFVVSISYPMNAGDEIKISYVGIYNERIILPNRFTQSIIRGLQGIVNADNRYTIRFTRDFTLRDEIDTYPVDGFDFENKNLHEEWKIFRKEQQFHIDKWLWDRITESIVGYKLDDNSKRVPSYERELYDEKYGTDTRFGLGDDQAFVDGKIALNSVINYLLDPNVDFTPIDINEFLKNNNFDTNEDIISTMEQIYSTFTYTHVNRIFFSVLYDAFSTKAKYSDIFKTSMVSLHGIRPFQTSGIFDD